MRLFFIFASLLAFLLYAHALQAPYYLDDQTVLETAGDMSAGIRSLGYFSFWLNIQLSHLVGPLFAWREVVFIRFFNVWIHVFAATALFWLVRELTDRRLTAVIAATLFLVHPIQTQAVTYLTQRFEAQAAAFMICAAAAYVRFRKNGNKGWLIGAGIFAIAAGATKETAVILPAWLLLIELIFFSEPKSIWRNWRIIVPLVLTPVIVYPAWKTFLQSGPTLTWVPWETYFASQGLVLAKYLQLLIFPWRQFLIYDVHPVQSFSPSLAFQWAIVLAVLGLGLFWLRRNKLAGFGILSFFVLLLPVTILPLPDLIFEHRVYPAAAGFMMTAAVLLSSLKRRSALVVTAILVIVLGYKTHTRNSEWNDTIAFFETHRSGFPEGAFALVHLGNHYLGIGEVNKALEMTLEARKHEDRFNTYYRKIGLTTIATNLGLMHLAKRQYQQAEAEAFRALAVTPDEPLTLLLLGNTYLQTKRYEQARETFEKLARLKPDDPASWKWLREADLKLNKTEAAKEAEKRIDDIERDKEVRESSRLSIPEAYRSHALFGLVFVALGIAILVIRFVAAQRREIMSSLRVS
jgi:tetratricopeptide (TPR) repeat protein